VTNWINGALATFAFEIRRSFSVHRLMVAIGLALFPPVMLSVVGRIAFSRGSSVAGDVGQYMLLALVFLVALICVLMLLLWATPNVHSELEGKTWHFLVVRPGGRIACFLGKYFVAVSVSFATTLISLSGCMLVVQGYGGVEDPLYTLVCLAGVYGLACIVYGAIFSLIGTIFIKRAMVVGAGFLIGVEGILAILPAVVSKVTMSYHLRETGLNWLGWFVPYSKSEYRFQFGPEWPVWIHIVCIAVMTVLALITGMIVITNRQYITSEE